MKTDSEKLCLLADWIDHKFGDGSDGESTEVQDDLRRIAGTLKDQKSSDSVVEENVKFLRDRSNVGLKKYGVTLDRDDLNPVEWVQHLREELADALNYATAVQRKMSKD